MSAPADRKNLSFPDSLVPRVLERYLEIGVLPMPDPATLDQLLKLAFFASLERDEGRPLTFSLSLVDPVAFLQASDDTWAPSPFEKPRAATVSEVVRLAPATNWRHSTIAVDTDPRGTLRIVGLAHTNLDHYRIAHLEGSEAHSRVLWHARVTASGPGRLRIGVHEADLFTFEAGEELPPAVRVFGETGLVHDQLLKNAGKLADSEGVPNGWLEEVVYRLISNIATSGHGGTLVICPSESCPGNADIKYRSASTWLKYQFLRSWQAFREKARADSSAAAPSNPPIDERARSERYQDAYQKQRAWPSRQNYLRDAVSATARLAGVDGAVLLGPDLALIGFGAMFRFEGSSPKASRATDPLASQDGRSPLNLDHFGARHRSAAGFCDQNPGSIGFVVSEDGPVACVLRPRQEDELVVWRPVGLEWGASPSPPPNRFEMLRAARSGDIT